jgi:hypothetical protein
MLVRSGAGGETMKVVQVCAYNFNCLPGHSLISRCGSGYNVRAAVTAAVREIFRDPKLSHKRIVDFKMSIVVISDRQIQDAPDGAENEKK